MLAEQLWATTKRSNHALISRTKNTFYTMLPTSVHLSIVSSPPIDIRQRCITCLVFFCFGVKRMFTRSRISLVIPRPDKWREENQAWWMFCPPSEFTLSSPPAHEIDPAKPVHDWSTGERSFLRYTVCQEKTMNTRCLKWRNNCGSVLKNEGKIG